MGYARTVKAAAAAAAALLAAVGVRFLAPAAAAFVEEELPRARAVAATWLTPPYLYLVINAIIISIAASSRFQPSGGGGRPPAPSYAPVPAADVDADAIGGGGVAGEEMVQDGIQPVAALQVPAAVPLVAVKPAEVAAVEEPVVEIRTVPVAPAPAPEDEVDEDFSISRSTWRPRRRRAEPEVAADVETTEVPPFADLTNSREKPLVSARFSRKAAKPSPEGSRALRVARPRKEETLESTWKAITEGRGPPLARHLKKSDTWDTRPGRRPSGGGSSGEVDPAAVVPAPAGAMRKAETFNDGGGAGKSSKAAAPPAPVRREPSLGQDELNRRVEAFIHKFNMEMRLQRQESLKHYNDMLGRSSRY